MSEASSNSENSEYAINAADTIVSLNSAWLRFARENGATGLTRESVVGRCLWEFVAGRTTQELYSALFRSARSCGSELRLPFRCDGPDIFRFMELRVVPIACDGLQLSGRLLREQARPYNSILDRLILRTSEKLPMCSVCLRVKILDHEWVEADTAIERLDLFGAVAMPELEYRVCDRCIGALRPDQACADAC